MKMEKVKVLTNNKIATDTYEIVLKPKVMSAILPGQFVNIKLETLMLRRPISVCSIDEDRYTLVYKVVGEGTLLMSKLNSGDELDVLAPLGSSFPIHNDLDEVLIIGGGVGVPPLYEVAKQYRNMNKKVNVVLGFSDYDAIFYEEQFKALGCEVSIATMDGSYGIKGTVLDAIEASGIKIDTIYSCGPMVMLEALDQKYQKGYLSFESRMGCGMGACMGCVCKDQKDKELYYRICKEGPVFEIGKVAFEC